jgi:hypothetical protein
MDYKERYLRWMEMLWERHQSLTREEKRKEEVLEIFETLCELAKRRVETPYLPLWESCSSIAYSEKEATIKSRLQKKARENSL